jgi:hypothetical protein
VRPKVRGHDHERDAAAPVAAGERDAAAGPGLARRNSLELVDLGCGEGDLDGTSVLLEPTDALGSRNQHDVVALSEEPAERHLGGRVPPRG